MGEIDARVAKQNVCAIWPLSFPYLRPYPGDAIASPDGGNAYGELGLLQQTIEDYTEDIRLNPKYAIAYYKRGVAYGLLGDTAQAERDIARAKELGYPSL